MVHKDFACYYSPVLKAAFNSDFLEGQTQTYTIEDCKALTIKFLVEWIYTQQISFDAIERTTAGKENHLALVGLWILAEKFLIPQLQNHVIRKVYELNHEANTIPLHCLNYVWENTPPGSPLRLFLLHLFASRARIDLYSKCPDSYPKEMLADIIKLIGNNGGQRPKDLDPGIDMSRYDVQEVIEK